jgi:hypothetical protein
MALRVVFFFYDHEMWPLALSEGHKFQPHEDLGRRDTEDFEGNKN